MRKYHNTKVVIDGHQFDSKAEGAYYLYLKNSGVTYTMHEHFEIISAFKLNGKRYSHRIYTPDFCIYEGEKLTKVIDVKGGNATMTTPARLRMLLFMIRYHMPVTLARYDYRSGLFEEEQV